MEQTNDVWPMTPDAQLPVPHGVEVPVSITIGSKTIPAGRLQLKMPGGDSQVTAELANLLRALADQLVDERHSWPRQVWRVRDRVQLPASIARGTVVQVDQRRKVYLVDLGAAGTTEISWHEVDRPTAKVELKPAVAVAAVLEEVAAGRVVHTVPKAG